MNTAPKPHIQMLATLRIAAHNGTMPIPGDRWVAVAALDAAIATLAPPSGEGVVSGLDDATLLRSLVEDVDDMAPEIRTQLRMIADGINTGKIRCRRCGEHADMRISTATLPTTPQSMPVDGVRSLLLRYGRHDADCATCHDSMDKPRPVCTCGFDAALTTPPPASQERGGDIDLAIAVMNAADAYERTMQNYHDGKDRQILRGQLKLLRDFCGPIIEASNAEAIAKRDASPPSSAAAEPKEVQEEWNPCIECGADPGEPCYPNCCTHAAEQAKPDIVDAVDDPNGECPTCHQSLHVEQAQAGELPEVMPCSFAVFDEYGDSADDRVWDYAREQVSAAIRSRLAGGVTVDDAMVERAVAAYMDHGDYTITRDLIRAMLIAALGAK